MQYKKLQLVWLLLAVSCSSYKKDEIPGVYVASDYKNTIDTIRVQENGFYFRVIYNKKTRKKTFSYKGAWHVEKKLNHEYIVFQDFLLNFDKPLEPDQHNELDNSPSSFLIEFELSGNIYFCTGWYDDQYCYFKTE